MRQGMDGLAAGGNDTAAPVPTVGPALGAAAMRRLLDTAEHFLACRDRARSFAPWAEPAAPCSLAEAIARDFAGFDLEAAEADFRAALAALSGGPPALSDT